MKPRALASLAVLVAGCASQSSSTADDTTATHVTWLLDRFERAARRQQDGNVGPLVRERLWSVYPLGGEARACFEAAVRDRPDGPGLAFAGVALIPFHDPSSVAVIADRILDPRISETTRWWLMSSMPYVIAIGDAMAPESGALNDESRQFVARLRKYAGLMVEVGGVGRGHAKQIRMLLDHMPDPAEDSLHMAGMLLWHMSAYLWGTLDLGDMDVLEPLLDPGRGLAYRNLSVAVSLAACRDFNAALRGKTEKEVEAGEKRVAAAIHSWWREHLREHPGGDWTAAARKGLADAGFSLEADLTSDKSSAELLRALAAPGYECYVAARLLNRAHDTHFDLQRIFLAGKYAMSFLAPPLDSKDALERLREYWRERLTR